MPAQTTLEPLAYSVEQVIQLTTLSEATIFRLIKKGKLQHRKVGSRVLVPRVALEKFLLGKKS